MDSFQSHLTVPANKTSATILSRGKQKNSATHLTVPTTNCRLYVQPANTAFAVSDRPAGAQISLQIGPDKLTKAGNTDSI